MMTTKASDIPTRDNGLAKDTSSNTFADQPSSVTAGTARQTGNELGSCAKDLTMPCDDSCSDVTSRRSHEPFETTSSSGNSPSNESSSQRLSSYDSSQHGELSAFSTTDSKRHIHPLDALENSFKWLPSSSPIHRPHAAAAAAAASPGSAIPPVATSNRNLLRAKSNCGAAAALEKLKGRKVRRQRFSCLSPAVSVEEEDAVRKAWSARVTRGPESGHVSWEQGKEELVRWEVDPSRLVIQDFVARGSFGSVHRGEYDGREVAVKLLTWGQPEKMLQSEREFMRDLFAQEVLVWSTLEHKNICQFVGALLGGPDSYSFPSMVVDHGGALRVSRDVCCVVLEYLGGGTLKAMMADAQARRKRLAVTRVVRIALQVAQGLAYLHSKNIVHRDLKSDNLLFDAKKKVVKIADFGIARAAPTDKSMCRRTGTYGYMAPEVLKERPYDHKCDIYSFGVVLWELFCCKNPFPFAGLQVEEVTSLVNQGVRPEIPCDCPPALAALMRQCWHNDPTQRPDMSRVVEVLQQMDKQQTAVLSCQCM